jgi:hypothetical protein
MAAQSQHIFGGDHQRLLNAADALVAALESARHSGELRHIRGDLVQLQHDVERVRRILEHQPPLGVGACEVFAF